MRIHSVRVKNFRTLRDVTIEFGSVTTMIGPNGTGKSTVLRALDWFFNGRPASLVEADCAFGAEDQDIEVRVTFSGLTNRDRQELGKYVPDEASTFTAWKIRKPDGAEVLSANARGFQDFSSIKAASSATEKRDLYGSLRSRRPELGLPATNSATAVDQAMMTWEAANTDRLVEIPESVQTNFFGFNGTGKMSGLFDFVLVPADLRASEESIDGKTSIIGRILERSVDRTAADDQIAKIVDDSRTRQQEVYAATFKAQLAQMADHLNKVVAAYSPGRTIAIAPQEIELKAPRTTFAVSVVDTGSETPVERQGHGFQRTLLISALQVLAESAAAPGEGVICLAIEEPELFQHPVQAQAFAKLIRELAEDEGKRMQVMYATHSPYFVEAKHFHQIRRLVRTEDSPPKVTVHSTSVAEVRKRLTGIVRPEVVERQLDSATTSQLSVALFSSSVLLVEGTTEAAVFSGVVDREQTAGLESRGVAVVPVGGKSSIALAHAIVTCLGIPAYAVFDADGGFEARARANGKSADKVDEERREHVSANRKLLKYFDLEETDFPQMQVLAEVAIFSDHLESYLSEQWPEWAEACVEIEAATGTRLTKNQLAYRTVTRSAQGPVPAMLTDIAARVTSRLQG